MLTSSKSLGKKGLVLPTAHKHLAKGYQEALSTSCSLQRVFLGVFHSSSPGDRMKAAGGKAAEAAGAGRQLVSIPSPLLSASLSPYFHRSSAPGAGRAQHWVHRAVFQQPQRVGQPWLPQPDKLAPRPKWKSKAAGSRA